MYHMPQRKDINVDELNLKEGDILLIGTSYTPDGLTWIDKVYIGFFVERDEDFIYINMNNILNGKISYIAYEIITDIQKIELELNHDE